MKAQLPTITRRNLRDMAVSEKKQVAEHCMPRIYIVKLKNEKN